VDGPSAYLDDRENRALFSRGARVVLRAPDASGHMLVVTRVVRVAEPEGENP
jgi:hypothetical protein